MTVEQVKCPKCDGVGSISAFSNYANGICFCCKGNKTISVNVDKLREGVSAENRVKAEWILASTEESYKGLSFAKLSKIRNFAHAGWGLQEAYPTMLSHWFKVGESAFQAAQEIYRSNQVG